MEVRMEEVLMNEAGPYDPWRDIPHGDLCREVERARCDLNTAAATEDTVRRMGESVLHYHSTELAARRATALALAYARLAAALKEEVDREPVQW